MNGVEQQICGWDIAILQHYDAVVRGLWPVVNEGRTGHGTPATECVKDPAHCLLPTAHCRWVTVWVLDRDEDETASC